VEYHYPKPTCFFLAFERLVFLKQLSKHYCTIILGPTDRETEHIGPRLITSNFSNANTMIFQ